MLRFLRIRNLAVIESVEVEFDPGFNVLTGETGAGKSILVEAVGLLLGARAAADLVRTGESLATIEAIFDASTSLSTSASTSLSTSASTSLTAGGSTSLTAGGSTSASDRELIVRREITNQGRSRSFINGALATAGALRDLSQRLVERHDH